jgi:hypothetical protein
LNKVEADFLASRCEREIKAIKENQRWTCSATWKRTKRIFCKAWTQGEDYHVHDKSTPGVETEPEQIGKRLINTNLTWKRTKRIFCKAWTQGEDYHVHDKSTLGVETEPEQIGKRLINTKKWYAADVGHETTILLFGAFFDGVRT